MNKTTGIDEAWVKSVIKAQDGVEDILDITVKPAIGENENYGSTLYRLILKLQMNKQIHLKNVILKVKSKKLTSFSEKEEEFIFDTENRIYSEVFLKMGELMRNKNDAENILWPRYLGHKKQHLLMEDLLPEGFALYPKTKPLDDLHTNAVMKVYGKLHGLGMILAQKGLVKLDDFKTQFINGAVLVMPKFYTSGVQGLVQVMKQWGPEWEDKIPIIRKTGESVAEKLKELAIKSEKFGPCAFNHGDCWTNNILFKYGLDKSTPSEIRLVDFQMGHFNSPAWDLTYFFYNCLLPHERFEKMESYINIYADSLASTHRRYGFEGNSPTADEIGQEVKLLSYYGFLNTVTIRPLLLASAEEGFSLESEKLLDDFPGGPQCIHKLSFYNSPEIHKILQYEIKKYLNLE